MSRPRSRHHRPDRLMRLATLVVTAVALLAPAAALAQADLSLGGNAPDTSVAGEPLQYSLSIYNAGPNPAPNVVLDDVLPAGVTLLGDSLNACTVTSTAADGQQTLQCALGSLDVFDVLELDVVTLVEHDFLVDRGVTSAVNTPVVSSGVADPDGSDNGSTLTTVIEAQADLDIQVFGNVPSAPAGEEFTYTIIVENHGPSTAENLVIQDTMVTSEFLDANGCSLAVRTEGGAIDQFECNFALSVGVFELGTFGSNWLNPRGAPCDWNAGADPGEEENCSEVTDRDLGRVIITINMTATEAVTLQTVANVTSDTPDPNSANNTANEVNSFEAVADLEVQKSAGPATLAGGTATWNVTVINHGPSAAGEVLLLDTLPAGLVDGTVQITGNLYEDILGSPVMGDEVSCVMGTPGDPLDPATCDLGGMPAGWGAMLTISGAVSPSFVADHGGGLQPPIGLTNDVEVTSDTWDAVLDGDCSVWPCPPAPDEPNFASATVEVDEAADLVLAKFGVGTPRAGETFTYEFDISNLGPSVARDVTLRDFLPDGVEAISAFLNLEGATGSVPMPCEVTEGTNVLICPLGDVPLTDGAPILAFLDILIRSDVPNGTVLTNFADLNLTDTPDPVPGNNSDSAEVNVQTRADISVRKLGAPQNPVAGTTFSYMLEVENLGPSDAFDVQVTDTLPAGIRFVESNSFCTEGAPGTISCRPAGNAFSNPPYVLPAGEKVSFEVLAAIDPDILGPVPNLASASVGNPNFSITSFGDTINVVGSADLRITKLAPPEVQEGETFTYTILVDNLGPSRSWNQVIRDTLVADGFAQLNGCSLAIQTAGGAIDEFDCSFAAATGVFDIGTMGANWLNPRGWNDPDLDPPEADLGRIIITMDLSATGSTHLDNFADVTADTPDPDLSNNSVTVPVSVEATANLEVTKTAVGEVLEEGWSPLALDITDPGPFPTVPNYSAVEDRVAAGRRLRYTIEITNNGPGVAHNVHYRDVLPAGIVVVPGTLTVTRGPCVLGTPGDPDNPMECGLGTLGPVGVLDDPEDLPDTAIVEFDVVVDDGLSHGTVITNGVEVFSDAFDPDNFDNFSSNQSIVVVTPDDDFTEEFASGELDLEGFVVKFTPDGSTNHYRACDDTTAMEPLSPSASIGLPLGDDEFAEVVLGAGRKVKLYGEKYDRVYVGSNGYVTFGAGDVEHQQALETHFDMPRVSALFADLDPGTAGTVWFSQEPDRLIIAWDGVPSYSSSTPNTFSMELFFDGTILLRYESLDPDLATLAGLSRGAGVPVPFVESDLANGTYLTCPDILFEDSFESNTTDMWSGGMP